MSVLALVPVFPIIAIFDAESNVTRVTALFFVGCVYFRMQTPPGVTVTLQPTERGSRTAAASPP